MKTLLCILALSVCGLAQCQPVDPCQSVGTCYQLPASITALTFTGPAEQTYYKLGKFEPMQIEPESAWLPYGRIERPYCLFVHAGGGTPPYTFSATGLPPGLNIEPNGWLHGRIGEPNYVYDYSVVFTATDAAGATITMTKSMEICRDKMNCSGFQK